MTGGGWEITGDMIGSASRVVDSLLKSVEIAKLHLFGAERSQGPFAIASRHTDEVRSRLKMLIFHLHSVLVGIRVWGNVEPATGTTSCISRNSLDHIKIQSSIVMSVSVIASFGQCVNSPDFHHRSLT